MQGELGTRGPAGGRGNLVECRSRWQRRCDTGDLTRITGAPELGEERLELVKVSVDRDFDGEDLALLDRRLTLDLGGMLVTASIDPTHTLELDLLGLRLGPGVDGAGVRVELGLDIVRVKGGSRHDGLDLAQPLAFELRRDPGKLRVGRVMHRPCEFAEKVGGVEALGHGVMFRARGGRRDRDG